MSFVSYAQNLEDVMLWRALGHVAGGFYMDVGAWSPVEDSVTAAFYEHGWRGINIEPNPEFFEQLQRARPRDVNLAVAIADAGGTATMHLLDNPGLSTLVDSVAAMHAERGVGARRREVDVARLDEIWRRHVPPGQDVHFLKVDVEGAEAAVLRGNDWAAQRPWVVVVEATAPMSRQSRHAEWEPLLLAADYRLAYDDGINRFYVGAGHDDLLPAFRHPPNYFDGFVPYAQVRAEQKAELAMERSAAEHRRASLADERAWQAEQRAQAADERAWQAELRAARAEENAWRAETRSAQAERRAEAAEARAADAEQRARSVDERSRLAERGPDGLEARLQAVYDSWSWRITAPLRSVLGALLRLRSIASTRHAHRYPLAPPPPAALPDEHREATEPPPPPAQDLADDLPPRVRRVRADLLRLARTPSVASRPSGPPRLAYVSPLPPECSGIADYSADLVPALCEHFQVDVFVEQGRIDAEPVTSRCAVHDAGSLRARAGDYDAVIYNFGNSHFHTWMADLLAEVPGVVVLHDFYLGGLVWSIGDQPGRAGVRFEQLHYGHGHGALAECLRGRDQGEAFFRYPCNRIVLENATGIVVHSGEALRLARRWFGDAASADWVRITLVRAPARPRDRHEARHRLGLPESAFVVCNFGLVGATKLNHRLLQAWLDSSLAREPDGLLVFVGDAGPSDYSRALRSRIAGSGLGERVRITGWADGETFRDYLAAADLAVQLRSHSRGETSATVLDCMNHGLATIVNAHGSMAELPADAVRVIPDAFEHGQLVEALEDLRRDAPGRRALGEKARELIARDHAPERCARMARDAIEQFAERGQRREAELRPVIETLGPDPGDEAARLDRAERLVIGSRSPFRLPQLLLDVTETARTDRRTGIERVARALALALLESPPEGYRVEPVVLSHAGGRWHYRAACAFSAGLLGVSSPLADRPIDISRGDRLLGLDISGETFVRASDDGLFDRLRDGGVDCRMMVFDLLPVLRPECFPPGADRSFGAWLDRVARLDGAVCISGTVAGSLRAWTRNRHADRAPAFSIESFPLGADVAAAAPTRGLPHDAEALLARLAAEPTVLMVGTLEPRKRHLQALEAFSLLWQRRSRVNLVIVGRAGWQHLPPDQQRDIPDLLHALRTHPESGRRLLWLDGVSDEYLDRVYAAASGLLAASIDEGFGLPLIEAAVKGLPVLARDISVFREVAGESARYFRAETGAQLAEAVEAWISAGFEPRPSPGIALMTWKRSAEELARVMLAPRTQIEVGCAADTRSA